MQYLSECGILMKTKFLFILEYSFLIGIKKKNETNLSHVYVILCLFSLTCFPLLSVTLLSYTSLFVSNRCR